MGQGCVCVSPFQTKTEATTVIIGFIVSLTCGAPNAWYLTSGKMQDDLSLSDSQMNIITSVGLVGLYFTFFAGLIFDYAGVSFTVFLGGVCSSLGYLLMSFGQSSTWIMILFAFMAVGFGCGASFVSVLGFGLKVVSHNPGFAVSVIGGGMSLSLAFISLVLALVNKVMCTQSSDGIRECPDNIWRNELRTIAVVIFIVMIPGSIVFFFLDRRYRIETNQIDVKNINSADSVTDSYETVSILSDRDSPFPRDPIKTDSFLTTSREIVTSLMNRYSVVVDISYIIGVGGGLVGITQTGTLWDAYTASTPQRSEWVFYISTFFSIFNCFIGGILFGTIADIFVSRGIPRVRAVAVVFFISAVIFIVTSALCLIAFPNLSEQIFLMLLLMLIGVPFGSSVTAFPTIIGEYYNIAHFGAYLGIFQVGVAGVTFLVPVYCTALTSFSDNYSLVFSTFSLFYFLSSIALFFVNVPPLYSASSSSTSSFSSTSSSTDRTL